VSAPAAVEVAASRPSSIWRRRVACHGRRPAQHPRRALRQGHRHRPDADQHPQQFPPLQRAHGQTENKIVYIAKLFNEEIHLVAGAGITSIDQLKGRKVNLDAKGSGTSYSMRDIFKTLGIDVEEVSLSQTEAIEKVKSGEIAATALIAGKPVRSMSRLGAADGLHFLAVPFSQPLIADYLPTSLTYDDDPDLIPAGQTVETIAVGAVLITFNWPKTNPATNPSSSRTSAPAPGGDRYQRIEKFVEAFFARIDDFKKPPRHPKWREVNLAATLPGWTRFEAAQNWLYRQRIAAGQRGGASGH
jgi:hypothetical protein